MKEMVTSGIRLGLNFKIMLLAFILFCFVLVFIPLWQIGVNHSLDQQLVLEAVRLRDLNDEERAIRTEIARMKTEKEEAVWLSSLTDEERLRLASAD